MAGVPLAERTILILEDEFLIAADMEQICLDAGARGVTIIGDLIEIEDAIGFDAAILDLTLGETSTADFAATLVAREIPFVFATGATDLEALGADFPRVPVVAKPLAGPELVEALHAVLEGRSGRDMPDPEDGISPPCR